MFTVGVLIVMKISIITPMYNSEKYIGRMIQALKGLDYPKEDIEIIIIDNGSEDNSVNIVNKFGLSCLVMKGCSISKMRNAGAQIATGEILGFVDSDCIVTRNWATVARENIAGVGIVGGYYGLGESPGWIEKTWHDLKKDITEDVSFVSAGNMVIKKSTFLELGGFDEDLETGEDWELCQRVINYGYRVVNQPELRVVHLGNHKTLIGIIKKERWYGRGMFGALKGRFLSKPLLVSIIFLLLLVIGFSSILITRFNMAIITLLLIVLIVLRTTYHFTLRVKTNRSLVFFKCIPITFCYLVGRSLSILDLMKMKILPNTLDG